jgi:hypothetical protein
MSMLQQAKRIRKANAKRCAVKGKDKTKMVTMSLWTNREPKAGASGMKAGGKDGVSYRDLMAASRGVRRD